MNKDTNKTENIYAVILAGGIGSRFWPLSRSTTPKQLLSVVGDESLLQATIKRLSPLIPPEKVYVVTNDEQAELIRLHLSYDEGEPLNPGYIVEPMGRNTAPAIGLAALHLAEIDPEAIMAVLPADHIIGEGQKFRDHLVRGAELARKGHLVTFGVIPTTPETGYGYIKSEALGTGKSKAEKALKVERFVEKPDKERAEAYLREGVYYWNAGIFLWKAKKILEEIKAHLPHTYERLMEIREGGDINGAYEAMEAISIDNGILEKAEDVMVIPADFDWSDMGSWNSFGEILSTDRDGNVIKGRVVDLGNSNSVIFGCNRVVAAIGLKDMIVVDTPDATLVCPKERAQDVKAVVEALKEKGYTEHAEHKTTNRPWGSYTVLESGPGYKIKKIVVKPGQRLSLQLHHRRSEHWVVVKGTAKVRRGEEDKIVSLNESIDIPVETKHRLENPGEKPLEIIEVQNGAYLEEDDIVRFDDDFKREIS
ncbi:MAG: mannose-1-phosphate guanylyltransferase/mannose-6-phosphate isomerase [Thermodesulfobacteriota bacterium]